MAFLACVLLLATLLSPAATTGTATATALDGAHSSSVVTTRVSRVSPDATFVAEFRRPSVARRLSDGVAQPAAASPRPGDVKLAPSQLAALVALTGWKAAELCSEWPGVTCDDTGMVTNIQLQDYLISARTTTPPGRVPADIAAFTALQVLNLRGQDLSGPIPTDAFRNLTSLQELNLSFNPLNGSLEFLAFLPALQYLDLHATQLTGEIPAALGNATALSFLSLAGTNLTASELPASLSALTKLAHIDLSFLQFSSVPSWIARLAQLTFLDVTAPSGLTPARSSPFPADWTALTSLNTLRAAGNGFSGSLPATISALTALSELDLSYSALVGSVPVLPSSLLFLSLSHNALEGPIPASFAAPKLMEMDLSHNHLTWPMPATFTGLPALATIDISNNSFTGPFPSAMLSAPHYSRLDISHNQFTGVVPPAVFTLPSLSTLSIAHNQLEGSLPATGLSSYLASLYARMSGVDRHQQQPAHRLPAALHCPPHLSQPPSSAANPFPSSLSHPQRPPLHTRTVATGWVTGRGPGECDGRSEATGGKKTGRGGEGPRRPPRTPSPSFPMPPPPPPPFPTLAQTRRQA
ncbi:unnamed protein product [Closterium sp. Naga37s-1]|nr:unnamed protein product [Closterium sp. Naga37s-1]